MASVRRVIVTLEVNTDLPLKDLRNVEIWTHGNSTQVLQAQANVAKNLLKSPKAKKRKVKKVLPSAMVDERTAFPAVESSVG